MEKKSKMLIAFVLLALIASVAYSYYRYVSFGDFLVDESQVEAVEETGESDAIEGPVPEEESPANAGSAESVSVEGEGQ